MIVNWNNYPDTIECLNSLREVTYNNYQIIVVDNGSKNESVKNITNMNPRLNVIALKENLGFPGGCNVGIKAALEIGAEHIFLLNNDTIICDKEILDKMASFMDTNLEMGMISPVILYNNSDKIWFCGGQLDRNTGILELWDSGEKWRDFANPSVRPCSFLAGCALFVRTHILSKTDGLFEPYFLTSEESELCVRIADMGYGLGVFEGAKIYHKISRSVGVQSPLGVYFLYRNKLFFAKRNAQNFGPAALFKIIRYYISGFIAYSIKGKFDLSVALMRGVRDFILGRDGMGFYNGKL